MFAPLIMKRIICIFLYYLIINTAVPCFLYSYCCNDEQPSGIVLMTEEYSDDCDSCSPFFNCSHCISSKYLNEKNITASAQSESGRCIIISSQNNPSCKTAGIFQPPRI